MTSQQMEKKYSKPALSTIQPMVSIYFDDGYVTDYTIIKPWAISKGIIANVAIIGASVGDGAHRFMNFAEIQELRDLGWGIDCHCWTHDDFRTLSEAQLATQFSSAIALFSSKGLTTTNLCYPYGYYNETVVKIARKYFNFALGSVYGTNDKAIDNYIVKRIDFAVYTLEQMKVVVDNIGTSYVIFYSHSEGISADDMQKIGDLVDYIKTKSIAITTVTDALKIHGNSIDIGDYDFNKKYFKVASDGSTNIFDTPYVNAPLICDSNTPITSFPLYKISARSFVTVDNSLIPFSSGAGTLITYRLCFNDSVNFQEFHAFDNSCIAKRKWNTTTVSWDAWIKYSSDANIRLSNVQIAGNVFGDIGANTSKDYIIPVVGLQTFSVINCTFAISIPSGIVYTCVCATAGNLTLKLINVTASAIACGTRTINVTAFN